MEIQRKKQTQRPKNVLTMTSGGFFRAYLVPISKTLVLAFDMDFWGAFGYHPVKLIS